MTDNFIGPAAFAVSVGAEAAGIFTGDPPARDAVLVVNNTSGTRVFFSDSADESRLFPAAPGLPITLPFKAGQVYAFATSTTEEVVEEAEIEVRAVTVDSALARSMEIYLAGLAQNVAAMVPTTCGADDPVLQVEAIRETDLLGLNAPVVNIHQFDISGRNLEVRSSAGTAFDWIAATAIAGERLVRVEFEDIPRGSTSFFVVAIADDDETDVLGLFRGTVKGT